MRLVSALLLVAIPVAVLRSGGTATGVIDPLFQPLPVTVLRLILSLHKILRLRTGYTVRRESAGTARQATRQYDRDRGDGKEGFF